LTQDSVIALDPVHGPVAVDSAFERIVRSWAVQRLSYVKQLEFVDLIYPGACHCRYEHSLGTAHLARRLAQRQGFYDLIRLQWSHAFKQGVAKGVWPRLLADLCGLDDPGTWPPIFFEDLMFAAGIVHDIGHGPMSHLSEEVGSRLLEKDRMLMPQLPRDDGEPRKLSIHEWLTFFLLTWDCKVNGFDWGNGDDLTAEAIKKRLGSALGLDEDQLPETFEPVRGCLAGAGWRRRRQQIEEGFQELFRLRGRDWERSGLVINLPAASEAERATKVGQILRWITACMAVGALPTADVFLHGAYDADRVDYLQRDAIHSGVAYGRFDVDRLLGPGLTIPTVEPEDISARRDPRSTPSIDYMKGLVALENMMVGRDQMYFTVFYHPTCLLIAEAFYNLATGKWGSAGNRAVRKYVKEHRISIGSKDQKEQFDRLGRIVGFFQLMDCEDFDFMHMLRGAGRTGEEAKALLNRRQHKKVCVLSWAQLRPDRRPSGSLPVRGGIAAKQAREAVDQWLESDAGKRFRDALERIEQLVARFAAWRLPNGKIRWFSVAYSPQEPELELEVIVARRHLLPSASTEWSFASEVSPFLAAIAPAHRRNRILCIGLHLHIPVETDQRFRLKAGSDSGAIRAPIPVESGH